VWDVVVGDSYFGRVIAGKATGGQNATRARHHRPASPSIFIKEIFVLYPVN
jgi:hypothetical protein